MAAAKPMILIVDDEKTQREGLRAALEYCGVLPGE